MESIKESKALQKHAAAASEALKKIKKNDLAELRALKVPSQIIVDVLKAVYYALGYKSQEEQDEIHQKFRNHKTLLSDLTEFKASSLSCDDATVVKAMIKDITQKNCQKTSMVLEKLYIWVSNVADEAILLGTASDESPATDEDASGEPASAEGVTAELNELALEEQKVR